MFYLKRIVGIGEPETEMMKDGGRLYDKIVSKSVEWRSVLGMRKFKYDEIWFGVKLIDHELMISGILDALYRIGNRYRLIEVKNTGFKGKPPQDHIVQATTYAVLLERQNKIKVEWIEFYYLRDKKYYIKKYTPQLKSLWMRIYRDIRGVINSDMLPRKTRDRWKCNTCFYFKRECYGYLEE